MQDGASASLTAPNGSAQATLVGAALRAAEGAPPLLVEAHGTGTSLGGPTEARALARALASEVASGGPAAGLPAVGVSGVKANVGHLEPTAGMAGLLALTHSLARCATAPNGKLRRLNGHLSVASPAATSPPLLLAHGALSAVQKPRRGQSDQTPAGGVSSFGYSGTIAHAVFTSAALLPLAAAEPAAAPLGYRRRAHPWAYLRTAGAATAAASAPGTTAPGDAPTAFNID